MDAKKHAASVEGDVKMPKKIGARFAAYGGEIADENVALVPGKRIVQTWRYDDWPAGHYSLMVIDLAPAGKKTRMSFRQISVPDNKAKDIAGGAHVLLGADGSNLQDAIAGRPGTGG
ncbi:MAG: hypothetical protein FJX78_02490 [Armatimonadetes bacterium]|nr:hypothetical protein [Armatimonadota bacterium]